MVFRSKCLTFVDFSFFFFFLFCFSPFYGRETFFLNFADDGGYEGDNDAYIMFLLQVSM